MQDVLLKRHSIRKYTGETLTKGQIQGLLEAAMSAPSAGNEKPWHFVVITEQSKKEAIPEFHPYSGMVRQAPVVIAVCADLGLERFPGNWPLDCSAATENILLSAEAQGLGAVWLGIYPEEDRMEGLGKLLELPEGVKAFSLVVVGHPAETKEQASRFNAERVHRENW